MSTSLPSSSTLSARTGFLHHFHCQALKAYSTSTSGNPTSASGLLQFASTKLISLSKNSFLSASMLWRTTSRMRFEGLFQVSAKVGISPGRPFLIQAARLDEEVHKTTNFYGKMTRNMVIDSKFWVSRAFLASDLQCLALQIFCNMYLESIFAHFFDKSGPKNLF